MFARMPLFLFLVSGIFYALSAFYAPTTNEKAEILRNAAIGFMGIGATLIQPKL
jgi:hypothetical protein